MVLGGVGGQVHADGGGGDPGEHQQVAVAPGEGAAQALPAERRPAHGVEVDPPDGGGDGETEGGGDARAGVEAGGGQRGAGGDHRLAEHDQREQAVALGDVGGVEGLALVGDDGQRRRRHQHDHARRPQHVAGAARAPRRAEPDGAAQRVAGGVAAGEAAPVLGVAAGAQEQRGQQQLERGVGDRELAPIRRTRSCRRRRPSRSPRPIAANQTRCGRRRRRCRTPRRTRCSPSTPTRPGRTGRRSGRCRPGRVVVEVGGERGDGGDEAEVEEQLEPARVPLLRRVGVAERRRPAPSRTRRGDGHRGPQARRVISREMAQRRSSSMKLPPFQTLIDRHADDVLRYLRASVGPVDAEDCFQETFLSALRAYPRLRDAGNLRGWLLTIAHNKALDAHRSRAREAGAGAEIDDRVAADPEPGPPDTRLWTAVRGLPQKQRSAVYLRFAGDLDYASIGEAIGCSEVAASQNVRAGLATIRKEWPRCSEEQDREAAARAEDEGLVDVAYTDLDWPIGRLPLARPTRVWCGWRSTARTRTRRWASRRAGVAEGAGVARAAGQRAAGAEEYSRARARSSTCRWTGRWCPPVPAAGCWSTGRIPYGSWRPTGTWRSRRQREGGAGDGRCAGLEPDPGRGALPPRVAPTAADRLRRRLRSSGTCSPTRAQAPRCSRPRGVPGGQDPWHMCQGS